MFNCLFIALFIEIKKKILLHTKIHIFINLLQNYIIMGLHINKFNKLYNKIFIIKILRVKKYLHSLSLDL